MRRRRTPGPAVVAVTGAGTALGRALLERLAARHDDAPDLVGADVRDPLLAHHLVGVTTVVHLDLSFDAVGDPVARTALNVRGTATLLEAARVAGVRRVVLITSVDVYGAPAGGAVPLAEDALLLAPADGSLTGDLVEVERLAQHAALTGLEVVVLRPAAVVGGHFGPTYDGSLLHSLSASRLLAVRGVEPLWQLCHVDDLLSALELAALGRVSGPLVVACDGWLTQRQVEELSGRRRLELPALVALSTAERLHRVGATSGSPRELDRLLHPLVVDAARLRALGWSPTWTNTAALTAHLADRPAPTGRAAAYTTAGATAAGATVAMVGTAALVRRARRRRGR